MTQSSLSDIEKTISILKNRDFTVKVIKEIKLFFEVIALIKAIKD